MNRCWDAHSHLANYTWSTQTPLVGQNIGWRWRRGCKILTRASRWRVLQGHNGSIGGESQKSRSSSIYCRTHRVPTYPWLFPPSITSVIFLHNLHNLLLQSLSSFLHFYLPQTPQPIHFPKAYDNSYSKTNREHKYKDESSRVTSTIFPHNLRNVKTLKRKQFYIFWLESPFSSSYSLSTDVHHLCPPQMLDAKGNCQCRRCLSMSLFASGLKTKSVPYCCHM